MGLLDPTLRNVSRLGLGLAGSLIGEVRRRDGSRLRRTPAGRIALRGVGQRLLGLLKGDGARDQAADETGHADSEPPSPTATAERAAWERFVVALERLTEVQAAYALDPDELGAEKVRWAEGDLEDAVAVAGEFEVKNIRWILT
jgi:hypothetical protein